MLCFGIGFNIQFVVGKERKMFKRSFWAKCDKCGQDIYMAYVLPPNEYQHRYLPFEDESLDCCHLDYCQRTKNKRKQKN